MRSVAWYAAAGSGSGLALLLGAGASVAANKIAFAGWGLAMALAWVLLLRWGVMHRWPAHAVAGRLLLAFGLGMTFFARLEARWLEDLDLGCRALLPAIYAPLLTRPTSAQDVALGLAVAGALVLVVGRHLPTLKRTPPPGPRPGGVTEGTGGTP